MMIHHRRKKKTKTKTKRVGGGEKDFAAFGSSVGRRRLRGWSSSAAAGGFSLKLGFHVSAWTENSRALLSVVFLQHRLQRVQQEHAERLPVPVVDFHLAVSRDRFGCSSFGRLGFKRNRKCRKRF